MITYTIIAIIVGMMAVMRVEEWEDAEPVAMGIACLVFGAIWPISLSLAVFYHTAKWLGGMATLEEPIPFRAYNAGRTVHWFALGNPDWYVGYEELEPVSEKIYQMHLDVSEKIYQMYLDAEEKMG